MVVVARPQHMQRCFGGYDPNSIETMITNYSYQEDFPDFDPETWVLEWNQFRDFVISENILTESEYNQILESMLHQLFVVSKMIHGELPFSEKAFTWLAADFIIDAQKNPKLLEINTNPGLALDPAFFAKNNKLMNELGFILIEFFGPGKSTWKSMEEMLPRSWILLIDETMEPRGYHRFNHECYRDPFP